MHLVTQQSHQKEMAEVPLHLSHRQQPGRHLLPPRALLSSSNEGLSQLSLSPPRFCRVLQCHAPLSTHPGRLMPVLMEMCHAFGSGRLARLMLKVELLPRSGFLLLSTGQGEATACGRSQHPRGVSCDGILFLWVGEAMFLLSAGSPSWQEARQCPSLAAVIE